MYSWLNVINNHDHQLSNWIYCIIVTYKLEIKLSTNKIITVISILNFLLFFMIQIILLKGKSYMRVKRKTIEINWILSWSESEHEWEGGYL